MHVHLGGIVLNMDRILTVYLLCTTTLCAGYKYETKWFTVPLDHFSFTTSKTFQIKYLENEEFWDRGGGPIFFYTGNEGVIETFANHTGFMWDIAEEFKAKLVFAEHRYYGESMPFGNSSLSKENVGFLSSSQALADYADLINFLQGNKVKPTYPVIAFGGSYGGMLSAYFRIKYPHLVTGAIAASAPIHMYTGMVPCESFNRIVTSSFKIASASCVDNIRKSWGVLRQFLKSANNTAWIQKDWKLCRAPNTTDEVDHLLNFLTDMYVDLAMVNYPYPSEFLMPLPGQPVRTVCQYLDGNLEGQKLVEGVGKVMTVYANYDGKKKCINYTENDYASLGTDAWEFQACTEMVMPICATGKDDMFEPASWNITAESEVCQKRFGVSPKPDLAKIEYGGDRIQAASNIVFSNGLLDPWAAGGILNSVSATIKAVVIIDTAHHLDLMARNDKDPSSVRVARDIHRRNIQSWIRQFQELAEHDARG